MRPQALLVSCVALWLLCGLPSLAAGERVLVTHPTLRDPILSPSGRHIAAVVDNRFVPEDGDQAADLYVYTLDTNSWRRVPRLTLLGAPETYGTGIITLLSISEDGRYVAYVGVRWLPGVNGEHQDFLARYDLQTDTRTVIRDNAFDPFAQPVMSRDGSTFAWIGANHAVIVATVGQTPLTVGQGCPVTDRVCPATVALTARGEQVAYAVVNGGEATIETFDRTSLTRRQYPEVRTDASNTLAMSASGNYIASVGVKSVLLDVAAQRILASGFAAGTLRPVITDDGAYLRGGFSPQTLGADVFDVRLATPLTAIPRFPMPTNPRVCCLVGLSASGAIGLGTLQHGETVLVDLDGDADGLYDPWEDFIGLDSSNPADAAADQDGDGRSNADEFRLRSHPFGRYQRTFAEGVTSAYFDTALHLFRPRLNGQTLAAPPVITWLGNGRRVSRPYQPSFSPEPGPFEVRPPSELGTSSYSVIVESPWPLAVERITRWGSPMATGAHGTSGATPSTTWYFAEGATIGGFQLFYLLANPGESTATVDVDFLKAAGGVVSRRYLVLPGQRHTIWVNTQGDGLHAAEVSARITASQPIVAERAMYLSGAGGGFAGGTASTAVSAPATRWLFAEGATGSVFDAFILLANPGQTPARAEVTFRLPEGQSVTRVATVAPESRLTLWVDQEDPLLANAAFSTMVTADVPIVAERAMWWKTPGSVGWGEGHSEVGATVGATQWAVADMPESAFLLIANASSQPGLVEVTYYSEAGGGAATRTYAIAGDGRVTAWPAQDNPSLPPARHRAEIKSLASGSGPAVPIVVERAAYGAGLSTGTVYLATPIP